MTDHFVELVCGNVDNNVFLSDPRVALPGCLDYPVTAYMIPISKALLFKNVPSKSATSPHTPLGKVLKCAGKRLLSVRSIACLNRVAAAISSSMFRPLIGQYQ
ncbi:hypothetical protein [Ochrobactrum teleogrylli]|uniref:hypothetical protein n=1 Tax=Ochrobactrum teleogrylli TaxID=2479765 RepID=UPI00366FB928